MTDPDRTECFYTTLDASGNGSVQFTARKAAVLVTVTKVTVEMSVTSSGKVELSKNGQFLTSMPVTTRMEASGGESLHTSEYLTGAIIGGPINTTVKFTFFYNETAVNP